MNETATSRSSKPPPQPPPPPPPPSSSLVVAEKRPRRPAGCAGIFFKLYDWNRKFAKKLSTKVLAPAPSNKAYKKFRGHEKLPMPKLLLIAGENSGGFPNAKKIGYGGGCGRANVEHRLQNHKMRSASLVARLMGLESMPLVQREKSTQCLLSEAPGLMDENFGSEQKGSDEEAISSENPKAKNEARPQKLQKTGPPERCPVARIGAEAFQLKGVLSGSKKHPTKFVSPLKTPRSSSGRTAQARLIDAAARILEPGLQAKSRGKCALTYFNHMRQPPDNELFPKGQLVRSPDLSKQSECFGSGAESSKGLSSCKACGTPLAAAMDLRAIIEEDQPVLSCSLSGSVNAFSQDFGSSNRETAISASEQEMDSLSQKRQSQPMAPVAQVKDNPQNNKELVTGRKPPSEEGQTGWHMASQQWKRQNDASLSGASKHRPKSQVPKGKDIFPPRSKPNNLEGRRFSSDANAGPSDFVALDGSLSVGTKQKMVSKGNYSKLVTEACCNEQENPFRHPRTSVHRRRTTNVGGQSVNKGITGSTSRNQRIDRFESSCANNTGLDSCSVDWSCLNGKINNQGGSCTVRCKSSNASLMFSSPPKHKTRVVPSKETGRNTNDSFSDNRYQQKRFILDGNDGKMSSNKHFPQGDALGAFLVQKLAKLAHQEHDELEGSLPERSKAMILEELISVVSKEMPIPPKERMVQGDWKYDYNKRKESSGDRLWHDTDFGQTEVKRKGTSVQFQEEGDHFSPGSVLHASLSTDSCLSSSLDNSSLEEKIFPAEPGAMLHCDSMECSTSQSLGPDSVFSDSATSLDRTAIGETYISTQLFNHISGILYSMNDVGARLTESKLNYAEEVIFNAELLFGNAVMSVPNGTDNFLLGPALLDKLECLARITSTGSLLSFGVTKEDNQFRTFLLDSVIEYLDLKNTRYYKSGFGAQRRLPLSMSREMLICEASEEITRWTHMAGKLPDEIIDCEMSHSLGKWTDFEIEGFETGEEVGSAIFHLLIDEITMDIHQCRLGTP